MGPVQSKDEAKKKWRAEAMKAHPDRGGSGVRAKKINAEWDAWRASHEYKDMKTKISAVLALRGMDAENFRFLTSGS
jgi:hypothetical protein